MSVSRNDLPVKDSNVKKKSMKQSRLIKKAFCVFNFCPVWLIMFRKLIKFFV